MTTTLIPELKPNSKLYNDYLSNAPIFKTFFPTNDKLNDREFVRSMAESFGNRNATIKSISETMTGFELNPKQVKNIELFKHNNSLAVVTSHHICLLGSPISLFYKIQSAIQFAKDLKAKHKNIEFIPVFWLEDNDVANPEACSINILNSDSDLIETSMMCGSQFIKKEFISNLIIPEDFNNQIDKLFEQMTKNKYIDEAKKFFTNAYTSGELCKIGFIKLLQQLFAEDGLLFVSESTAQQLGYSRFVALLETSNQWKSVELISRANRKLKDAGYPVQSKHTDVNIFYYFNGEKRRIEITATNDYIVGGKIISKFDMTNEIIEHPERFTPNFLLRPLFQDTVLPTIAYIAGEQELQSACQVYNIYEVFAVRQPAIINQHHALIVNQEVKTFLSKNNLTPNYFFDQFENIENNILTEHRSKDNDSLLITAKKTIIDTIDNLKNNLSKFDSSIVNCCEVMSSNITKEFERFEVNLNASSRSKNMKFVKEYKAISNWIYPNGEHQENILTPVNIISLFGLVGFKQLIELLCKQDRKQSWVIGE